MVALVTGASSGIGEATARRLARDGAKLVLVARREDRLRALADELGGATVVAVDLTDDDAPQRVADAVESEHGRLDLLVNNAGAAWRGNFADIGWEGVEKHMKVNFDATVRLTHALLADPAPVGAVLDRQRRERGGAGLAAEVGRVLGQQVRADRLERRPLPRGEAERACTWAWCCPASSRPRASRSAS